jgi:hypothetical protein
VLDPILLHNLLNNLNFVCVTLLMTLVFRFQLLPMTKGFLNLQYPDLHSYTNSKYQFFYLRRHTIYKHDVLK